MINCDNITTVAKVDLDPEGVGSLDMDTPAVTDRTLRHSLDIILLNPFEKAAPFSVLTACVVVSLPKRYS